MKPGRLFENALKQAHMTLKSGTEIKVSVKGKGQSLYLVLQASGVSSFEASVLDRAQKSALNDLEPYLPQLSVGERINALRKAAGFTLNTLAAKAEISKGSLCSIEKGERSVGLVVSKKIAKALGVSVGMLVG